MGDGWWGGVESPILDQLKSHLVLARILAEAISMAHSDMLYRLDIFRFYIYKPLLLLIFDPWEFIKT